MGSTMKVVPIKKSAKTERERQVLFGLIEYYIQTGKAVGSHALQEAGFQDMSSATIRNYFADLEKEGFLQQQHTSSGRIPTDLAYRTYAHTYLDSEEICSKEKFASLKEIHSREISTTLQHAAETLSEVANVAVFLSAPRFDHDFLIDAKLIAIDHSRILCALVTDFGMIKTEVLHTTSKLSAFSIKRIESYFHFRLTGQDEPTDLTDEEAELAQKFYNETMLRYVVGYSNFIEEDLYRTGFSELLNYPELRDAVTLASCLSLFENPQSMRLLLRECHKADHLKVWIGDELLPYMTGKPNAAVLATPYYINGKPIGAIGILGPTRIPYRKLIGTLRHLSDNISESLTNSIYKFKLTFRQPQEERLFLKKEEKLLVEHQTGESQ